MATLTESAEQARKAIKYGGIGLVVITLLWYLGIAAVNLYNKIYPPAPPPPTVDFGKLPGVNFPDNKDRPTISLELPTGKIPDFPDRMRVYRAPTKRSGFADAQNAIETATSLGFLFTPSQPSETDYVWTLQDQLASKLEMNIISGHFTLSRKWQNNPALAGEADFTSNQQIITETENYLKKINLLPDDLIGAEKITPLKANAGELVTALSLNDADFIRLDLFRKNLDEINPDTKEIVSSYPFYRTDPGKGLIRVIISGGKSLSEKYIYLLNDYTTIQYENSGTYPIKTGQAAWDELSKGGGFVTTSSPKAGAVKIRKIFLGYYDSDTSQNYAMPIYIFLGDNNFVAYVSAVSDTWITSK